MSFTTHLNSALAKFGVAGTSIAVLDGSGGKPVGLTAGQCRKPGLGGGASGRGMKMNPTIWLQQASLSKTIASAFAIEYFNARGIDMDTPVNAIFRQAGSSFQLRSRPGCPRPWAESVQLKHLVNHTSLGMHYVYGVPVNRHGGMPCPKELLEGVHERELGYAPLLVEKQPGTDFSYSGGGFVVLQHLLEEIEQRDIESIMRPFLDGCDMDDFSFDQPSQGRCDPGAARAEGYADDGRPVAEGVPLMFPPLAAGGHGTPLALASFLRHLSLAYNNPNGSGCISNSTARQMLGDENLVDLGCRDFMQSEMGLGVFVARAANPGMGVNKIMLHQAANDGFRGVYMVCFDGPAAANGPCGFVLLSNGDNQAMFMNCGIAKELLKRLEIGGIDWRVVEGKDFSTDGLKQAEIVNLGLKELVLDAFVDDPERPRRAPRARL